MNSGIRVVCWDYRCQFRRVFICPRPRCIARFCSRGPSVDSHREDGNLRNMERRKAERNSEAARTLGESGLSVHIIDGSFTPVVLFPKGQLIRDLEYMRGQHFLSTMVLDSESGMVVASTDTTEEGRFKESRPYFLNGKQGPYVQNLYYSNKSRGPAITFSAPIRSPDGELLGVLAGRGNVSKINEIITRSSGVPRRRRRVPPRHGYSPLLVPGIKYSQSPYKPTQRRHRNASQRRIRSQNHVSRKSIGYQPIAQIDFRLLRMRPSFRRAGVSS